ILANKGDINAIFRLIPSSTALGCCFIFTPSDGLLLPGGHQTIVITFESRILGEFHEDFVFSVEGNPEPVQVTISGCVIGPTFHFTSPSLHFGEVSFGFPSTLTCTLNNTSLVPMTFDLHVPGDGTGDPSVTSDKQVSDQRRSTWSYSKCGVKPKEFTVTPNHGTLRAQGQMDIEVTLCSNSVKNYELALVVDVQGVGEEVLTLPILARCVVPSVQVVTSEIRFGRCFLKYPYQRTVTLSNENDLPACYGVIPQEAEENLAVLFSGPQPRGIIEPHFIQAVPLVVDVQYLGEQDAVAKVAIFGSEEPPHEIHLSCIGEGPVVHVSLTKLDFGKIPVLKDASRILKLSNQSLIPAHFLAQMVRSHSYWRVEPSEGVVPPESDMVLTIVANLDDTVRFQDKIHLVIEKSQINTIPVQALGTGTTIVTDKPFAPVLNLGAHFNSEPCRYHFKLANRGRRSHQLYWMTEGFPQFCKRTQSLPGGPTVKKSKASSPALEPLCPVFMLHPMRMELHPGQTIDVVLEGATDIPKLPDNMLAPQYKPLIMKNVSPLPLNVLLSLNGPFTIFDKTGEKNPGTQKPIKLDVHEELELSVQFDPAYKEDLYTRVAEEILTIQYLEHPHTDYVALWGEVHFPNLHFESTEVDFGCILNDTEVVRHMEMANCSPFPVKYRWSLLLDDWENQISHVITHAKPGSEAVPTSGENLRDRNGVFKR
uniref:Uncharacterized protein n=1 Tax=Latimeria chalumnae TaxID=7897 RepID=H2ZTJ9_LATCH